MKSTGWTERLGGVGALLMTWGVLGFAALAPVSIALSQVCGGVTLLGLLLALATRRLHWRSTPVDLALGLFVLAEVISLIFAVDRSWSFRALRDDWPLIFLVVFSRALRSSREVRRAFGVLLTSSTMVAAYAIWQLFAGQDLLRHRPLEPIGNCFIATGLFGHHLTYGGNLLISAVLALTLLSGAPTLRLGISSLLMLGGLVASFARTAWLGLIAGIAGLALSVEGRMRRISIGLLIGGPIVAIAIPPVRMRLAQVLAFHDDPRVRLWETALRIWKAHPVLGAGLGGYKLLFEQYKVPGVYQATGHPHNDLLKILVNSGIVGLAAFTFLWVRYFRCLASARRCLDAADPRRPLLLAGILVVVAFLVAAMGQCFLSDETVADLFWFFVAANLVVAREVQGEVG